MKRLYKLADQWKNERIKTSDHCWHMIIETDFVVVINFLTYVWAYEDDGEEGKNEKKPYKTKIPASGSPEQ
jgi:hypothetical protein